MPIKQTGYRSIYTQEGKVNFTDVNLKTSGVYLIRENKRLVYIGYSKSNLYKTMLRHFEDWNPTYGWYAVSYRDRMKRKKYTVKVIFLSPARAAKKEMELIKKHRPRDNQKKYTENETIRKKSKQDKSFKIIKDVPF